jgi:hypothetical protein
MGAIGPGDLVECIVECHEGSPGIMAHWLCGARIDKGRVYTVARVVSGVPDNFGIISDGLILTDPETHWPTLELNGGVGAWAAEHFRPIYRPKAELLESLLRKTDEPVKEHA